MSKYGVFSGTYFHEFGLNTEKYYLLLFSPNTGKYGPEKTPYLDTFHEVKIQDMKDKNHDMKNKIQYVKKQNSRYQKKPYQTSMIEIFFENS